MPHWSPIVNEDISILNGSKCFSRVDLAEVCFQIGVTPESRELLIINTDFKLYEDTRLPFCVKMAPAIFQKTMDTMISDLSGTAIYLDDIVMQQELQERVIPLFQHIQE